MNNTPEKPKIRKIRYRTARPTGREYVAGFVALCVSLFAFLVLSAVGCTEPARPMTTGPTDTVPIRYLTSDAMRVLLESLADSDPQVRANAIEVVAATKHIRLMPRVQRLLMDERAPVRFSAILAMGDLQYSLAERDLKQLLNDNDENVRIAAGYALYRLGHTEYLKVFRNAIASDDQTVRANAALLLGKSGDSSTLTQRSLWWTLRRKDSNDKVRFQAAEALAMLGDEQIYPKLWAMLISAYADDRVIGIKAMGALGTHKAKNALITMLDDAVLEVRLAAAEQLGRLNDPIGEPEVLEVFTKNLTADLDTEGLERVRRFTALAIGQIGTDSLAKYLPQLLQDESKSVRIAAAKAVFQHVMKK
jgi:HEAT repeat protein